MTGIVCSIATLSPVYGSTNPTRSGVRPGSNGPDTDTWAPAASARGVEPPIMVVPVAPAGSASMIGAPGSTGTARSFMMSSR